MQTNKKTELGRVVRFTLFSASAGLIEMGAFAALSALTAWSYWPRYLIALVLSVLWNFTLNRKFTFKSASNVPEGRWRSWRCITRCSRLPRRCSAVG